MAVLIGLTASFVLFLKADLSGAKLAGAKINESLFDHVNLTGASANNAELIRCLFHEGQLKDAVTRLLSTVNDPLWRCILSTRRQAAIR